MRTPTSGQRMRLDPLPDNGGRIKNHDAVKRRTTWLKAREIRRQLHPIAHQQAVADQLGITHQAVEQIEMRALTRIVEAFQAEIIDEKTA